MRDTSISLLHRRREWISWSFAPTSSLSSLISPPGSE